MLIIPGIETSFLDCPDWSLVTIPPELYRSPWSDVNAWGKIVIEELWFPGLTLKTVINWDFFGINVLRTFKLY
jgi:hypothetical protein